MSEKGILEAKLASIHDANTDARRDTFFREICTDAKKTLLVRQEQKVFDIVPTVHRLYFKLSVQL